MKKSHLIRNYAIRHHKQAGMTLIELTVVLLILIGLAGLLIPYVGSFSQTTHDSTNSNNITQLNNAFGRYVADKNKLPPHVDTLTNGVADLGSAGGNCSGAAAWEIYCGLANTSMFDVADYSANTIAQASIKESGINMAVANDPNVTNKTFGTSTGMLMLNMPATYTTTRFAKVAPIDVDGDATATVEEHLAKALGRDPMVYGSGCYDYLAFGIGDNNELIQSTMAAAPVYFPQNADMGPASAYAHFIAIVQVDAANTGTDTMGRDCSTFTEKAKFLGIVANVPDTESETLVGINTLLSDGWENRAAN